MFAFSFTSEPWALLRFSHASRALRGFFLQVRTRACQEIQGYYHILATGQPIPQPYHDREGKKMRVPVGIKRCGMNYRFSD